VLFSDSKCLDCGVISDPRLFPLSCHALQESVHYEECVPVHRGDMSQIHPASQVARRHTQGVGYRNHKKWHGDVGKVLGIKKSVSVPYMPCCNSDPGHPGCQEYHPCCQQTKGANGCKNIFTCCGAPGS